MNGRFYGLDRLKIALTMLVIAHHAGQPYGGSGGFWYFESREPSIHLGTFFSVNAGFFMSLFFFISGYFTPASLDRKGPGLFLSDRAKRIGLPILFGFLIMVPLLTYAFYIHFRAYPDIGFWQYYLGVYFGLDGEPAGWTGPSWPDMQFAHLWFLEHLLVYAGLYACYRYVRRGRRTEKERKRTAIRNGPILLFALAVSLATFAVRIRHPIDHWTGFLGIIQTEFAHVPQYAALFIAGLLAYRRDWISTLSTKVGLAWLIVGLSIAFLRYSGILTVYAQGGANLESLLYSAVETLLCVGMCIGLTWLFRTAFNKAGALTDRLSSASFTVYVLHVPILVALQFALAGITMPIFAKFAVVAAAGTILSFAVGLLMRQIAKRVRKLVSNLDKKRESSQHAAA